MRLLFWLPLLTAAIAGPAHAERAGEPAAIKAHAYTLDNGLRVILHEDHATPVTTIYLRYAVGSKDEKPGRSGFAHLFEHLMFEGSKHVPEGAFDSLLESVGGRNNGSTNADRTDYIVQIPSHHVPLALYLEADRMAGLWDVMTEKKLSGQRDVVKNERRSGYENAPYGLAELAIQQALWPPGHGNHNLTIGTMEDLDAASMADIEAFYREFYVPGNAILVVAGDLDVTTTQRLIERFFAWMPRAPTPRLVTLEGQVEPLSGEVKLTAQDDVQAPKLILAWRSPPPFAPDSAELELATRILASGKASRLHRRLLLEEQLASEVYAALYPQVLGGELQLGAVIREGISPDRVLRIIDEELAALATSPPSAAELERAINSREAEFLREHEHVGRRAATFAHYAAMTGSPNFFAADLARYRAVTPSALQAAVARWLAPDARVVMQVLPNKESN